jgi:type I restriction enzyme S subunit
MYKNQSSKIESLKRMAEYRETEIGSIPAEWDIKTIEDIKADGKKSIISGPFGSNISSKYFVSTGIPVIRGNNLSLDLGTKFKDDDFVYITEEKAKELNTWAEKDDLIFTAAGTIGQVGLLAGSERFSKYIISNKQLRVSLNKGIVNPLFAYYWFASPSMIDRIIQRDTGSTIPLINLSVLKSLPIPVPPLPEQQAIASILGSLDDKIDLLHRQKITLEALVETLYRQWFVEEAEDDWEETNLYDVIELVGGGTPKTETAEYWGGNIKWISARDITPNNKGFITTTEKSITELGLVNSSAKTLPKYSTVISARGTVGKYCLVSENMAFSQSNYGVMPKFAGCHFFTYLLVAGAVEELQAAAYGSVFDTITTNTFKEHKIYIPAEPEIQAFELKVKPYFEKKLANCNQILALTNLRNTLLPKLMSGEIRVMV